MVQDREALVSKILKVRALADRGIDGERDVAIAMVEKLMSKYGIRDIDLASVECEIYDFKLRREDWHRKLACQVGYTVLGSGTFRIDKKKTRLYIECTPADAVEIAAMLDFYTSAYLEDLDIFYRAFLHKNNIFPPDDILKEPDDSDHYTKPPSPKENDRIIKMMAGIDRRMYRKQIGGMQDDDDM